jgi:hypothetical protein
MNIIAGQHPKHDGISGTYQKTIDERKLGFLLLKDDLVDLQGKEHILAMDFIRPGI